MLRKSIALTAALFTFAAVANTAKAIENPAVPSYKARFAGQILEGKNVGMFSGYVLRWRGATYSDLSFQDMTKSVFTSRSLSASDIQPDRAYLAGPLFYKGAPATISIALWKEGAAWKGSVQVVGNDGTVHMACTGNVQGSIALTP
jgi:hypothetical protein